MEPPPSLKMLCFERVFSGMTCEKEGCEAPPIAFLILQGEKILVCPKHFEYSMFWHDGLDCYSTHDNGSRPFRVYIGETVVYIYRNAADCRLVKRYENIKRSFIGTNLGEHPGNTILVEI